MTAGPITVGDLVKVTGYYTYCDIERHGTIARVVAVSDYPPGIIEGDRIVEAREIHPPYTDGSRAYGIPVPYRVGLVTLVAEEVPTS